MGSTVKHTTLLALTISGSLAFASSPASAQVDPTAPLDRLVDESSDTASGTALAQRQAAAGDLVEAAATLERVLLNDPDADEARAMHIGLLCRLDDPDGARTALARLAGRPVLDARWGEITAACGAIQRPTAGGDGK